MKKILTVLALSVACHASLAHEGHHHEHHKDLSLSNCLIQAPIADGKIAAAFFSLNNPSKESVKLTAVESSELSKNVQIHEMIMKDGTMEMKQVADYEVTPGEHQFKKGGYHIMLEDLEKLPQAGESYPLTLHFSNDKTLTCEAKVLTAPEVIEYFKTLGEEMPHHNHKHDHQHHKHHDHSHGKTK